MGWGTVKRKEACRVESRKRWVGGWVGERIEEEKVVGWVNV